MAKGVQEAIQPTSTWLQRFSEEAVYRAVLTLLAAQSVLTAMFAAPGTLLRATAFCLAVTHPIVILLLILVNYLYLPRTLGAFARPARSSFIAILVALIAYTILAAWYATTVLG